MQIRTAPVLEICDGDRTPRLPRVLEGIKIAFYARPGFRVSGGPKLSRPGPTNVADLARARLG